MGWLLLLWNPERCQVNKYSKKKNPKLSIPLNKLLLGNCQEHFFCFSFCLCSRSKSHSSVCQGIPGLACSSAPDELPYLSKQAWRSLSGFTDGLSSKLARASSVLFIISNVTSSVGPEPPYLLSER